MRPRYSHSKLAVPYCGSERLGTYMAIRDNGAVRRRDRGSCTCHGYTNNGYTCYYGYTCYGLGAVRRCDRGALPERGTAILSWLSRLLLLSTTTQHYYITTLLLTLLRCAVSARRG